MAMTQDASLSSKRAALAQTLQSFGRVVVAYSGGVDSTLVAAIAHDALGADALAVTAVSPAVARRDLDTARATARRFGWGHLVVGTHEGRREEYARNAPDRCYWCKTELFEVLAPIAAERRAQVVTGTNADDLGDYRPGLKAAAEHAIRAPLAELGVTKADVRSLSRSLGLPTADQPASPCLASRFAYGVRVTPEGLRRIENAEEVVRSFGFSEFRVRDHGDLARLEVLPSELERAAALAEQLSEALRALGFRYVTLDLCGFRSGSMNDVLSLPTITKERER